LDLASRVLLWIRNENTDFAGGIPAAEIVVLPCLPRLLALLLWRPYY
jgi:hypothetical protein